MMNKNEIIFNENLKGQPGLESKTHLLGIITKPDKSQAIIDFRTSRENYLGP